MNLRKVILTLASLVTLEVYSAMPVFHAYIAESWIEKLEKYDEPQKRAFMLGTLFPDIRYLGGISREQTHEEGISLQVLLTTRDPFLKGKRLHCFVDETRARIVHESQIFDILKGVPEEHKDTFLKLLEDEVIYSEKSWNKTLEYLEDVEERELDFGASIDLVNRWHRVLIMYFSVKPSELLTSLSEKNQGYMHIPPQLVKVWSTLLPTLASDEKVKNYVSLMFQEFTVLLQSASL